MACYMVDLARLFEILLLVLVWVYISIKAGREKIIGLAGMHFWFLLVLLFDLYTYFRVYESWHILDLDSLNLISRMIRLVGVATFAVYIVKYYLEG